MSEEKVYNKLMEGWALVIGPRKYHYFQKNGRALCGRWLYLGSDVHEELPAKPCKACLDKLSKIKGAD